MNRVHITVRTKGDNVASADKTNSYAHTYIQYTSTHVAAYSADQLSFVDGQIVSTFFVVLQHYHTR